MSDYKHKLVDVNGIQINIAYCGSGPLVILCHGFPGLAYSWRHQMDALAQAGFMVIAPDMRGYGKSTRPESSSEYNLDIQANDILSLIKLFSQDNKAFIIGHDFGANLAWHLAEHYQEFLHGVVSISVPYGMALANGGADYSPSTIFKQIAENHFFHMHYFQTQGLAEAEFHGRERELLEKLFWALSAQGNLLSWQDYPSEGTGYLDVLETPNQTLPWSWLSEADMDHYLEQYLFEGKEKAFTGGLNAYRVLDENWYIRNTMDEKNIQVPACFIAGEEDPVIKLATPDTLENMQASVPGLRNIVIIPEAGHFVQQEKPERVNQTLIDFLQNAL